MTPDRTVPPKISDFVRLDLPPAEVAEIDDGVVAHIINVGTSKANRITVMHSFGKKDFKPLFAVEALPQMLLQGTKNLSGAQIADKLDFYGAFINPTSRSAFTTLDVLSLNSFNRPILETLQDVISNPIFPEERFDVLKRKALMNFDLMCTHSKFIAAETLKELLAGKKHSYETRVDRKDIEDTNVNDVVRAWHDGFSRSKIHVFAAGDISDAVLDNIKAFAKNIKPHDIKTDVHPTLPYCPEKAGHYFIEKPDSKQTAISIGIPTIQRNSPDYIPLRIAVMALGGYFSSRLMTKIREELGLTYGINAYLGANIEGSNIHIAAQCDPNNVDEVIKEIQNQITLLATQPMSEEEFSRLKSYYMTTIASTLESFTSVCDYYESQLTVGIPSDYFFKQQEILRTVTPEILSEMIYKYCKFDEARTVVAGRKPGL